MDALCGTDKRWKRIIRWQRLANLFKEQRLLIFSGRCWKVQCSVSVLIRVWKKLENAARMKLLWEMLGREAHLKERHAEAGLRRPEAGAGVGARGGISGHAGYITLMGAHFGKGLF